jgi:hypothetical protein
MRVGPKRFDIFMARATTACGNNVVDAGEDCDDEGSSRATAAIRVVTTSGR